MLALAVGPRAVNQTVDPAGAPSAPITAPAATSAAETQGFLYGRITTVTGATHEGRLRFGDDEEAFWGDYFNGTKDGNPWLAHTPLQRPPEYGRPIEILGIEIPRQILGIQIGGRPPDPFRRPFMARFGDIARIEAQRRDVRVALKSGTVLDLQRFEASDFDDGVRVWDGQRGLVELDSLKIRTIEFLPTGRLDRVPGRLHGTVRTRQRAFTGYIQWDRKEGVGSDELEGGTADGKVALRFDTIRSIAHRSSDSSRVTLVDGREIELSGTREVGRENRGIYVDDRRYGRVLVSWDAFERVDFSPGGSGPGYGEFPPGGPLTGSVTTRDGRRLTGRLVYDLDESETTETLDAPSQGVDYTLPFGLIASIVPPGAADRGARLVEVILQSGEELQLQRVGDLADRNGGMLVFADGAQRADYVPWPDVERIDLDRPRATYPPLGGR